MDSSKSALRLLSNSADQQQQQRKRNNSSSVAATTASQHNKDSEEINEIDTSSELEDEVISSEENTSSGNNENEYSVEAIRSHRGIGANREYFIKWENYPENQNTWEPLAHLQNIKNLVREYEGKIRVSQQAQSQSTTKAAAHKLISSDEEDDDSIDISLIHLRKKPAAKTVSKDTKKILKQTSSITSSAQSKKSSTILKHLRSHSQEEDSSSSTKMNRKKAELKIASIKQSLAQQKNSLLAAILNRDISKSKETALGVQQIIESIANNNNSNTATTTTTTPGKRSFAQRNNGNPQGVEHPPVKKNKLNIIEFSLPAQSTTTTTANATAIIAPTASSYLKQQQKQQQKHLLGLKLQPIVKNNPTAAAVGSIISSSSATSSNTSNTSTPAQSTAIIIPNINSTVKSSSSSSTEMRMNILNRLTNDLNKEASTTLTPPETSTLINSSNNIIIADIPDAMTDQLSLGSAAVRSNPAGNKDIIAQPNPQGFYNILMKKPLGNTLPSNNIMSLIAAQKQQQQSQQQQQQQQQQASNKLERMLASDPSTFFEAHEDSDCEDPTSEAYMLKRSNKELLKVLEGESEKFKLQFTLSGNTDEDDVDDQEDEEEDKTKSKDTNKDKIFNLEKDLVQFKGESIQTIKDSKALIKEVILRELNQEIFKKSQLATDLMSRQQTQKNFCQISYFFPFEFRNKDASKAEQEKESSIQGNEESKKVAAVAEKDGSTTLEEEQKQQEHVQTVAEEEGHLRKETQIEEEYTQQPQQSVEPNSNDSNGQLVPSSSSTAENASGVHIVDEDFTRNQENNHNNSKSSAYSYINSFMNAVKSDESANSFATILTSQGYTHSDNIILNESANYQTNNNNSFMEMNQMSQNEEQQVAVVAVPLPFNQIIEQTATQMSQQYTPSKQQAIGSSLSVTKNSVQFQPISPFASSLKSYLNRQISDTFTMKRITSPMDKESSISQNYPPLPPAATFQKRLFQNNFIEQDKIIFSCEDQDVIVIPQDVIRENPANLSIPQVEQPAADDDDDEGESSLKKKIAPSEIVRDKSIEKERDIAVTSSSGKTGSYQISQQIATLMEAQLAGVGCAHDDTFMALEESNLEQENIINSGKVGVASSAIQDEEHEHEENDDETNYDANIEHNHNVESEVFEQQTAPKSNERVPLSANASKSRSREPSVQQTKALASQPNAPKSSSPNSTRSTYRDERLIKISKYDNSKSPSQKSDRQAKENDSKNSNLTERSRDPSRSQSSKKDMITQSSSNNARDRSRSSSHRDALQKNSNSNSRSQSNSSLHKSKKSNTFNQKTASSQTAPFKEDLKNGIPLRKSPNQAKSTTSSNPPVKKLVNPFHRNTIYDEDDEDEQPPQPPPKPAKAHTKHAAAKKIPEKELPPVMPEPINEDIWDDDDKNDICSSSTGNSSKLYNSNMIAYNINPYDNNNSLSLAQQQQQHTQQDNKSALINSYFRKESGINNKNRTNMNSFYAQNNDYSINDTPSANGFIKNSNVNKNNRMISSAEESEDYADRTEEESERESNQSKATKMLNGSYERQDDQNVAKQGIIEDKSRSQQSRKQSQENQKQQQHQQKQQQFQSSDEENQRITETENSRAADDSDYLEQQGNETPIIESTVQTQMQLFQEKQQKEQKLQLEQQRQQQQQQLEQEEQEQEEYRSTIDATEFQERTQEDSGVQGQKQPTQLTVCDMDIESNSNNDEGNSCNIKKDLGLKQLSAEEQIEAAKKLHELEEKQSIALQQLGDIGCPMLDVPDRITQHLISKGQVFLKVVWKPRENNLQMPPTFIEFMKIQESYPIIFSQYMLAQLFNQDIFSK